jgi:HEAT repeat protein
MLDRLIQALVESKNEAADDLLLEALRLGSDREKSVALDALFRRQTLYGLSGVIDRYDSVSDPIKLQVLEGIKTLMPALRECGRSASTNRRLAAMKVIAVGRQGKLAYVLSENMHQPDETVSRAAVEALVALARWVATETRRVQFAPVRHDVHGDLIPPAPSAYRDVIEQREEIEKAVNRAIDVHRGSYGQELLRAALLLADRPGSKTLDILQTPKHGGQSLMVRRLQQPPASEHVEAYLLAGSHMDLRSQFAAVFGHIEEVPVLDALLRRTHWLKDHQLRTCTQQVNRGVWFGDEELVKDVARRPVGDVPLVAEWIAASGTHDVLQDERFLLLLEKAREDLAAKVRLLRICLRRPRGASVRVLRELLTDTDERIVRMAAREIVRRKPNDYENFLLQLMTNAPESVRRVVGRAIGQTGFDNFWQRFDHLDKSTRKAAGRAMLKLLPDAPQRLARLLAAGPVAQRLKAMQVAHELGLSEQLKAMLVQIAADPNPKLRSKAVVLLGEIGSGVPEVLIDRVLRDADARVRANAIEVLEQRQDPQFVPLLSQMARSSHNRERANAIKALHRMRVGTASTSLVAMLRDPRSEHRISALWTLRQIGLWQLLREVAQVAKEDGDMRVRRYALGVLRAVATVVAEKKGDAG